MFATCDLQKKQEMCQEFTCDANIPILEAITVTTSTKHVLQGIGFTNAWSEGKLMLVNQPTWLGLKTHCAQAFNEQQGI